MKMEERLKQTAKAVIYNTYSRIVDNPLEYENITGKKMLKKVEAFYSNPNNILEICTERELKFLKKVLNNEDKLFDEKYYWERRKLSDKLLIGLYKSKLHVFEEVKESVEKALKMVKHKIVKENDRINEVILGYLRVNGISELDDLVSKTSKLLNLSEKEIRNWLDNNVMIKYYTYYNNEYNLGYREIFTPVYYIDYIDYLDTLKEERDNYTFKGVSSLTPEDYKKIFYKGFNTKKETVKKLYDKLDGIYALGAYIKEEILLVALINGNRDYIKNLIEKHSYGNEKLAKEVLELLDSAMDDMPSVALNGLTPNEYWKQQEQKYN